MQEQNYSFRDFSLILEKELKRRGIQKKDFAQAIGVTPIVFSNWKSGKYKPKQATVEKICSELGVPLSFFGCGTQTDEALNQELAYWKKKAEEAESKLEELKHISQLISQANERLHRII